MCLAYHNNDNWLIGDYEGTLQVWKGNNQDLVFRKGHEQAIECICVTKKYVLTGGRDGRLKILDPHLLPLHSLLLSSLLSLLPSSSSLLSLSFSSDSKKITVSTSTEILELQSKDNKFTENSKFSVKILVSGHQVRRPSPCAVWGLAVFPDGEKVTTVGDDGTLRVWGGEMKWIKTNLGNFKKGDVVVGGRREGRVRSREDEEG